MINTINLKTNSTRILNNNNQNANLQLNNIKNATFSPINDTGLKINFGNFSPVLNTQKRSNINFHDIDKKSPIKHTNFAAEDNIFLYSLEKSAALTAKIIDKNKSGSKTKLNLNTNGSSKTKNNISNNSKAKKKGISIKDILEGNFDENLIGKQAHSNRANSSNRSFQGSSKITTANPPAGDNFGSRANLVNLNNNNTSTTTNNNIFSKEKKVKENSFARVNSQERLNAARVSGRDLLKVENKSKVAAAINPKMIPTGKKSTKIGNREDDFINEDW